MKYVDAKIGSLVEYKHINLRVVPQIDNKPLCEGCAFSQKRAQQLGFGYVNCYTHGFLCTAHTRKDKRHVIFIAIKRADK